MYSHPSRYVVSAIDIRTYTILDTKDTSAHLLMINPIVRNYENVQIVIAQVAQGENSGSCSYVEFIQEAYSFTWFASDWDQVISVVSYILRALNSGIEISNPAEIAAQFGGKLQGNVVQWPKPNPLMVH